MSGWKFIKTAPRDGTRILGYGKHYEKVSERDGPGATQVIYWDGMWKTRLCISVDHMTHWQPLPDAPQGALPK